MLVHSVPSPDERMVPVLVRRCTQTRSSIRPLRYLSALRSLPGGFRDGRSLYRRLRVPRAGQIARKIGPLPTVIGADTAPVAVVITDTVPAPLLTTSLVTKVSTEELTT